MIQTLPKNYTNVTASTLKNTIEKIKEPLTKYVSIVNAKEGKVRGAIGYTLLDKEARELASEKLTEAVKAKGVGEIFCRFA